MTDLYHRSIEILLQNQYPSGGFPAAPNFPPYQYSWFRDGSFIAYALDMAGFPERSERFHAWCANTVIKHTGKIMKSINEAGKSAIASAGWHFHCRYEEDGSEVAGHWGNHQLDGLGTWLWALDRHINIFPQSKMILDYSQAIDLMAKYLSHLWRYPCSNCWEEDESEIHNSTLASVYAGLMAHSKFRSDQSSFHEAQKIKQFAIDAISHKGYLTKSLANEEIDASLLWVGWPYELVDLESSVFLSTLELIEKSLISSEGGVHRYPGDTYYGGGEWLLLSAWYGLVKHRMGDRETAQKQLRWIEHQADVNGNLPEQVNHHLIDDEYYDFWTGKWGHSANPLLWSHAMYIIAKQDIDG